MAALERFARKSLAGVGDAAAGEWSEVGEKAFHLRRRLSVKEEQVTGPMLDIRGTDEGLRRWQAVERFIPHHIRAWARQELEAPDA